MIGSRIVLPVVLALAGCDGMIGGGLCQEVTEHLQGCFGQSAAGAFGGRTCSPERASRLLDLDCNALSELMLSGDRETFSGGAKDPGVEREVREAIREAIREAVTTGLSEAWSQVLSALGVGLSDRRIYLLLAQTSSKSAAESRAARLAAILDGDARFAPFVVKLGTASYAVLHGPCPLDPSDDLPRRVADVVVARPQLVKELGGQISLTQNDDGTWANQISLPLHLLAYPGTAPASFGCAD